MKTRNLTLRMLQLDSNLSNTKFEEAYEKLVTRKKDLLSESDIRLILKLALIFLNTDDFDVQKFGYRILLAYSNLFEDYIPLYEVSINNDYIPIVKFIESQFPADIPNYSRFAGAYLDAYRNNFLRYKGENRIYLSIGQMIINKFVSNNENFAVVAPTSYGKSELILNKVSENFDKNICVIVPTKALVTQTRNNIESRCRIDKSSNKLITFPEMYIRDDPRKIIAVFTQERLLNMLQRNPLFIFEYILLDEAHNILGNDQRDILTLQTLYILKKRYPELVVNLFTPFLVNPDRLKLFASTDTINSQKTNEHLKVERYYYGQKRATELSLYDQFLDKNFVVTNDTGNVNDVSFVLSNCSQKNIIYLNKPSDVEKFARELSISADSTEQTRDLINTLSDYLHEEYYLTKTLKNGIVYHHGSMPELVRMYIEYKFSQLEQIHYLVTTSTLLQGVNLPADRLFLLTVRKGRRNLTPSEFRNLSGRICRLNEVFSPNTGSLQLLEPEIYVYKGKYETKANLRKFLKKSVQENSTIRDDILNVVIKDHIEQLTPDENINKVAALEYLEKIEPGSSGLENVVQPVSLIAKLCFKYNVHEFDISINSKTLESNLSRNIGTIKVSDTPTLVALIVDIFINGIQMRTKETYDHQKEYKGSFMERLKEVKAQAFYSMFMEWKTQSTAMKTMINKFLWYWKTLENNNKYVYVGAQWGEFKRNTTDRVALYVDISRKSLSEQINLAILRIKEEQDFIEYTLMKYVEILNELELIEDGFYNKMKYDTDDPNVIRFIKEGISPELAHELVKDKYQQFINISSGILKIDRSIIEAMKSEHVNDIVIFEMNYFVM